MRWFFRLQKNPTIWMPFYHVDISYHRTLWDFTSSSPRTKRTWKKDKQHKKNTSTLDAKSAVPPLGGFFPKDSCFDHFFFWGGDGRGSKIAGCFRIQIATGFLPKVSSTKLPPKVAKVGAFFQSGFRFLPGAPRGAKREKPTVRC